MEARQIAVPAPARSRCTLPEVGYADAFTAPADATPTRRLFARALDEAPLRTRSALLAGWSSIGLVLRRGEGTVLGWTVLADEPDATLLGTDSRIGMPAQLLLQRDGGAVVLCTFVACTSAATRLLWRGVQPAHVRVVPRVLAAGVR